MKQRQFGSNDEQDEKTDRRERFVRRKHDERDKIDVSRRPKGERYKRRHINFDQLDEDDLDAYVDDLSDY